MKSYHIEDSIKRQGGSLEQKPPWMKKTTFQRLRIKYVKYDEKGFNECNKECRAWFGPRVERFIDWYFPPYNMFDVYVEREEPKDKLF